MEKFVEILTRTGLTANEAKTYILLLKEPLSASLIAQNIKINRSNIYGVLDSLKKKGLCREIEGSVRQYVAVDPEIAFDFLRNELKTKITSLEKISKDLKPYYKANENYSTRETIKILHSRASITQTLEELELKAEKEVLAFSKPPYLMNVDNLDTLNIPQRESSAKGVKYRAVHEFEPENAENFIKRMEYFQGMGEEVRVAETLPMKLFIFDNKIAVFTLEDKANTMTNLTFTSFENTDVAKTFKQIFDQYWKKSEPLADFTKKYRRKQK